MQRVVWLVLPVAVVALLAAAVLANRPPSASTAFTLQPGDCFDIPADANVGDIATIACDGPHDAEAFVAEPLAVASATGYAAYPGEGAIATWVGAHCGADAQTAYAGEAAAARPDLLVGYFFPSADAWAQGERQVTCYLHAKAAKLSAPLRATGDGAGASSSPATGGPALPSASPAN